MHRLYFKLTESGSLEIFALHMFFTIIHGFLKIDNKTSLVIVTSLTSFGAVNCPYEITKTAAVSVTHLTFMKGEEFTALQQEVFLFTCG